MTKKPRTSRADINDQRQFAVLKEYIDGRISFGTAAERSGLTAWEFTDLIGQFNKKSGLLDFYARLRSGKVAAVPVPKTRNARVLHDFVHAAEFGRRFSRKKRILENELD